MPSHSLDIAGQLGFGGGRPPPPRRSPQGTGLIVLLLVSQLAQALEDTRLEKTEPEWGSMGSHGALERWKAGPAELWSATRD